MKSSQRIALVFAAVLGVIAVVAGGLKEYFARQQTELLLRLGDDISEQADKWKDATLGGVGSFSWWMDLGLGHGLVRQFGRWEELALLSIIVILLVLLWRPSQKPPE